MVLGGTAAVLHQSPALGRPVDVPDVLLPDDVVHAELAGMRLHELGEGSSTGGIRVDHEVQAETELVVLRVRTGAVAADASDPEHRSDDVSHRQGPWVDRTELIHRTRRHDGEHRLQIGRRRVVGEDRPPKSSRVRQVTAGGTEERTGGGSRVLDVLGVSDAVTVTVTSPGPPGPGQELHRPDRTVPPAVRVQDPAVGVRDSGDPYPVERRADDRWDHSMGCRERPSRQ